MRCSLKMAIIRLSLTRDEPDAEFHTSLAYEDRLLLRLRIERLRRRPGRSIRKAGASMCYRRPRLKRPASTAG